MAEALPSGSPAAPTRLGDRRLVTREGRERWRPLALRPRLRLRPSGLLLGLAVSSALATEAKAELWNPLEVLPKPNAIVGLDSSVTMGITPGCDNCHAPGHPSTRLEQVKTAVSATLPLFEDYFVFGGFEYSGCGYAKVEQRAVPPDPADPAASLSALQALVAGAQHCMTRERYFESMGQPMPTGCATFDCTGDIAILQSLLSGALAPQGFDPMEPWRVMACGSASVGSPCAWWPAKPPLIYPEAPDPGMCDCNDSGCHVAPELTEQPCAPLPDPPPIDPYPCWGTEGMPMQWTDLPCVLSHPDYPYYVNAPACQSDLTAAGSWCISDNIQCASGGSFSPSAAIQAQLALYQFPRWYERTLTAQMIEDEFCTPMRNAVRVARAGMLACSGGPLVVYPDPEAPAFCNAALLRDAICAAGSPLFDTCVCDDTDARCSNLDGNATSACGTALDFKARQQVAVCETYHPNHLRPYYLTQTDNRAVGGCRENMAMLFTDGYMGQTAQVAVEAAQARPYYSTIDAQSNMFVFRISDVFQSDADALMAALGQPGGAFDATDLSSLQGSMTRVLNRAYRGVYSGSSPGVSPFATSIAIHAFTVPGGLGAPPGADDTYLGFPARISLYQLNHGGSAAPAAFETDWQHKVDAISSCGPTAIGGTDVALLGPGGSFRNGTARTVVVPANSIDRDGNGVVDGNDAHPALRWGGFYSSGTSSPVIVEGPRDLLKAPYADYEATRTRPRGIYVQGNGYVHGFHGGTHDDDTPMQYGYQKISSYYDTGVADAGREILRYRPSWLQDPRVRYRYELNDLIQQPILTGELVAREVVFNEGEPAAEARTVLVGSQGKSGPGLFALDITNPCSITLLAEWTLPGPSDTASAEPHVTTIRSGAQRLPALIATGGLGGSANLYAFRLSDGALLYSLPLPAGTYPTAPSCVDVRGEGHATHCYVLSESGRLVRATLGAAGFDGYVDITPAGMGAGQRFGVAPVAFFGLDGEVNLVFGSGNFERFDQPDAVNNLYKVVDTDSRSALMATAGAQPANLSHACGSSFSGRIALQAGERIIASPLVTSEVVAFTAFTPTNTSCLTGRTTLYAMDFESCEDLLVDTPGQVPLPKDVGPGLPTTPVLHGASQSLIVGTSASPTGGQVVPTTVRMPNARNFTKKLFFRPWLDAR